MLLMLSYDLNRPGQDYKNLFEAIHRCGDAIHCLGSVWLLHTTMTVTQVQQILHQNMESNDYLMVVDITGQSRDGWMPKSVWEWARNYDCYQNNY